MGCNSYIAAMKPGKPEGHNKSKDYRVRYGSNKMRAYDDEAEDDSDDNEAISETMIKQGLYLRGEL